MLLVLCTLALLLEAWLPPKGPPTWAGLKIDDARKGKAHNDHGQATYNSKTLTQIVMRDTALIGRDCTRLRKTKALGPVVTQPKPLCKLKLDSNSSTSYTIMFLNDEK